MSEEPAKVIERQENGTFKGSGNPEGAKKGVKRLRTRMLEEKLAIAGYDPLDALIEVAQDKSTPRDIKVRVDMELMCFLYPKRKPQNEPVDIPLGSTNTLSELALAQSIIIKEVAQGKVSPDNGKIISELIECIRKAIETEEIEKRLDVLEKNSNGSRR